MKKVLLLTINCLVFSAILFAQNDDLPPMEPGKCYAKCVSPDEYNTTTERIETQAAYTRIDMILPQYETVSERVMIQPASVRIVEVPAVYEEVEERIMVKEESKRYVYTAAEYETIEERRMVAEESRKIIPIPGKWETVSNDYFYASSASGISTGSGSLLDPSNPNNPNNPDSPFNPNNPNSPYNPNNPDSPLNPNSPYNPNNPNSLWNPDNPDSPFNPSNLENGLQLSDEFLINAQIGSIMPYLVEEASVEIERIPAEYDIQTQEIEVSPKSTEWVQQPSTENCDDPDGNCMIWCYVEVPAQYQTINKRVSKGCADGYFLSGRTADGRDECARIVVQPAAYGARSVMVAAPTYREEVIPAKYEMVKKQVVKKPATMTEEIVPAEYKMVKKKVLKTAATYKYEVIPGEYKTIKRKVRRGLKRSGYTDPTGIIVNLPAGTDPSSTYPAVINPATGFPVNEIPGNGFPGSGNPFDPSNTGAGANPPSNFDPGALADYYSAGCPDGYTFDPADGICKRYTTIPAAYENVTKTDIKRGTVSTTWEEVLCPNKVSGNLIREVQRALNAKGYNCGTPDNVMGARTKAALAKFQKENNLPVGGMNFTTLQALGVKY